MREDLCPMDCAELILIDTEFKGNNTVTMTFRCEDCGAVVRRTYRLQKLKEEVDP